MQRFGGPSRCTILTFHAGDDERRMRHACRRERAMLQFDDEAARKLETVYSKRRCRGSKERHS